MGNTSIEGHVTSISTHWEPCAHFTAEVAASPVCADCGWLVFEHEAELPLAS